MAIVIYENLRGFVHSRPPLVIFMICLATFAVALMTFAYLVKIHNIPNPDVQEDWNTFLQSLSDVEFCVLSNSSDFVTETSTPSRASAPPKTEPAPEQPTPPVDLLQDGVVNVSVSMLVEMTPTADFVSIPHNITSLSTTLTGDQLGLSGPASGLEMNVTFVLPMEWNHTHCRKDGSCQKVQIYTCLSFQAPSSFFPTTPRPDTCHNVMENGVEYHVKMVGLGGRRSHRRQILECNSQPMLHVSYKLDPTLTLMLSLHDKSLINLHLMHTSYFLFVMVVVLFCYAIVRGRPAKLKVVHQMGEKYSPRSQSQA